MVGCASGADGDSSPPAVPATGRGRRAGVTARQRDKAGQPEGHRAQGTGHRGGVIC